MKQLIVVIIFAFITNNTFGQADFDIHLEPFNINGFTGIQSFAYGQHDGKIILIGGRKTGLHRRQPWASFDANGNNTDILVIDPETEQLWAVSVNNLPTNGLKEQLQSTNMQFHQDGNYLYIIGGYGFATSQNDHVTHDKLTAIRVDSTIAAIVNGNPIAPYFRQVSDDVFAVTGGQLGKLDGVYYLAGGQKFTGRYNPMNGATFTQAYMDAIKRFKIIDDGVNLSFQNIGSWVDVMHLHRRDYNMLPQIFPNGNYGFTMFSGVFQQTLDVPFLTSVDFDSTGYAVNPTFLQYLNHYHSAKIGIYDSVNHTMHNVFLGGIAQYYLDANGNLLQDDDVPFVTTIGRVSRFSDSTMTETHIGDMPDLLGAGSEFVLAENTPTLEQDIIDLQSLTGDTVLVGYVLGGIKSSGRNIFFINNGAESEAHSTLYKAYLIPSGLTSSTRVAKQKEYLKEWSVYPNPAKDYFNFKFELKEAANVQVFFCDNTAEIIMESDLGVLSTELQEFTIELENQETGIYFISIRVNGRLYTKKVLVE